MSARVQRYIHCCSTVLLLCPSSNGKVFGVRIDADDLPRVLEFGPWSVSNFDSRGGVKLYCHSTRQHGTRMLYLHRFILDAPQDPKIEVDHIHNRTLDTRKGEMRLVSKSLNQRNKRQSGPRNKYGMRGVTPRPNGRFAARVFINHKSKYLGSYGTPEEAGERVRQFLISQGAEYAAGASR